MPYISSNLDKITQFLPDFTDLRLTHRISQLNTLTLTVKNLDYDFTVQIVLPLLENLVFAKLQDQKSAYMPASAKNNNIVNYTNATIDTVYHLTRDFTVTQLVAYLTKKANLIKKQTLFGETVPKIISKVLNHLSGIDSNDATTGVKVKKLTANVLPILKKILYEDKKEEKKPQAALCESILKVIRIGGEQIFKAEFGKLVNQSITLLKNKETRAKGLKLLHTICSLAGFDNFGTVLEGIKEQLSSQKSVRNYSVRYLLDRLLTGDPNTHTGKLDYCIKDIIQFVKEEAFAEFFENKIEEKGKKLANAKAITKFIGSVASMDKGVS